jgi:hypothetical protein
VTAARTVDASLLVVPEPSLFIVRGLVSRAKAGTARAIAPNETSARTAHLKLKPVSYDTIASPSLQEK